jgi:nucleotide-binding universal stress UspA family protein
MKRIIVAVDGSDAGQRALRFAADIARRFGSKLTLLNVLPPQPFPLPLDAYGAALKEIEEGERAFSQKLLSDAAMRLEEPDVPMDKLVLHGKPAEGIAEAAKGADVDLVVVGSRGRGAVARTLLGSVSDRLVHICPKPILIVTEGRGFHDG